jgi:hypothetical protein
MQQLREVPGGDDAEAREKAGLFCKKEPKNFYS